jgi:REP element-mobilizing transposase RayT
VPTPEITNCIGGVICRYSEKYKIEIYAAVALSNHYHILASAPEGNLHLFAENVGREIAKRVNRILKRSGSLWGRRYDDQLVLEEYDALEGLLYVLTNPTKHSLVANSKDWPGFSTYQQAVIGKTRRYSFLNYTLLSEAKRRARSTGELIRRSNFETEYTLRTSPIPLHAEMGEKERCSLLKELLEKRNRKLYREIKSNGGVFLGRKAVLAQRTRGVFPKKSNKTNRPKCYSKCLVAVRLFREAQRELRSMYIEASRKYRLGERDTIFPPYCFLPPTHHIPKCFPYVHS